MKESPYLSGRDEFLPKMTGLPSLAGFNEAQLRKIMGLSKVRIYDPGETIITQGDFDCWIYILITGSVRVERDGKVIGTLQRVGELFGEMGVISCDARSASVIADKPTTCLAFDGSVFDRQGGEEHLAFIALFYRLFAEVLAGRLRETDAELARVKAELAELRQGKA